MMEKGLLDIGLFLEPTDTEGLDYIRLENTDYWVVEMRPDDPMVKKECAEFSCSEKMIEEVMPLKHNNQ